jgi:hypothetical protein
MKRLYAHIVFGALLVVAIEVFLVEGYFYSFRGSPNDWPGGLSLIAILLGINIPMLRQLPRWLGIFRGDIRFTVKVRAGVPAEWSFPLDLTDLKRGVLVVCFTNCSSDVVGRKITFEPENDDAREVIDERGEPKALGFGGTRRSAAHWSKGTGDAKKPLIYDWPVDDTPHCKGELHMAFDWNFIGTYLERKLPKSRTLEGQVFLFRR